MGCLFLPFELLFDAIIEGYFYLMQMIVPKNKFGRGLCIALKIFAGIFTCILLFIMFLGVFALISDDKDTRLLGICMVFISLAISLVQIIFGLVIRHKTKNR